MSGRVFGRGFALSAKQLSLAAACLFLVLSLLTVLFPGATMQLWRGYITVATPDSLPLSVLKSRLAAHHLEPLMLDTAQVSFTDFSGFKSIALSRLPGRLDTLDPRYDAYMKVLPAYFRSGAWNLTYVRAGWPFVVGLVKTAIALRGLDWQSGDYNEARAGLCILAEIVLLSLVLLRYRGEDRQFSLTILIGSLPWILIATEGSVEATGAGAIVFLAWSYLTELTLVTLPNLLEWKAAEPRLLERSTFVAAIALLSACSIVATKPGIGGVVVLGFAADASWLAARAVAVIGSHREHEHVLFLPVAIRRSAGWTSVGLVRLAIVILAIASLPLISHLIPTKNIDIPSPVVYPGFSRISWRGLEALWNHERESSLPTLADYVAHRAFQDGISYGRGYSFPRTNERIYLMSYSRTGSAVTGKPVVVMTYSRPWLHNALTRAKGVGRLLVAQGAPVFVARMQPERNAVPTGATLVGVVAVLAFGAGLIFIRRQGSAGLMVSFDGERSRAGAVIAPYERAALEEGSRGALAGCGKGD